MKEGVKVEVERLVRQAKKGDKDALVSLIMDRKEEYYRLAFVYMKNKEDSLDAISDMTLIIYNNIGQLKNLQMFYSWSKTILVNSCKKLLRDKNKVIVIENIEEEYKDFIKEEQVLVEEKILIEEYLSKLSKRHQDVIKLRYLLDLSYKEISEILKLPLGTVKSRISTALKILKQNLGGNHSERN